MARITAPGYLELFKAYEPFLLLGIANEWNGKDFAEAYAQAITTVRNAGLTHAFGRHWERLGSRL